MSATEDMRKILNHFEEVSSTMTLNETLDPKKFWAMATQKQTDEALDPNAMWGSHDKAQADQAADQQANLKNIVKVATASIDEYINSNKYRDVTTKVNGNTLEINVPCSWKVAGGNMGWYWPFSQTPFIRWAENMNHQVVAAIANAYKQQGWEFHRTWNTLQLINKR